MTLVLVTSEASEEVFSRGVQVELYLLNVDPNP